MTVTSNGAMNLSAGALTASGGNAGTGDAAGGNAGAINLTNTSATTGNITTGASTPRAPATRSEQARAAQRGSVVVTQNNATGGSNLANRGDQHERRHEGRGRGRRPQLGE